MSTDHVLAIAKEIIQCETRLQQLRIELDTIVTRPPSKIPAQSKKTLASKTLKAAAAQKERLEFKGGMSAAADYEVAQEILRMLKKTPCTQNQVIKQMRTEFNRTKRILQTLEEAKLIKRVHQHRVSANGTMTLGHYWQTA